jgi:hypothetical protein
LCGYGVITGFTKLSPTDALLIVLVFSIWYCTQHVVAQVVGHLSTIEVYLARIAMQQAGATRLEVISTPDGVRADEALYDVSHDLIVGDDRLGS